MVRMAESLHVDKAVEAMSALVTHRSVEVGTADRRVVMD